jgi:prepilin-type N-terminal cleavage/methylation domain-containing protein
MQPWSNVKGRLSEDSGFGLIEIIVSMFLLAILAMAFLPLLISSLRVTSVNTSIATATQLVSEQMERARAQGSVCSALPMSTTEVNAEDSTLTLKRTRGTCPAAANYPAAVPFTVTVVKAGSARPLAEATTLLYVSSP